MKNARLLSVAVLGLCAFAPGAIADPTSTDSKPNPYTQTDADGIPLSVMQPRANRTPEELDAIQKKQAQAALDKNWLVRGYEQQLQSRAEANSSTEQSGNLYYEIGSNKELAKLAGMPDLDTDNQLSLRTGAPHSTRDPEAAHPDSSLKVGGAISRNMTFKPLITPLGSPEMAGLSSYSSSGPHSAVSPFYSEPGHNTAVAKPAAAQPKPADNPLDLETPGLVAAQKDPLGDPSATDLTLDLLPGESMEHAKAHQDSVNSLQLPLPSSVDQLHKSQAGQLSVPGSQNLTKSSAPTAPPKASQTPAPDPNAPIQATQLPPVNPVRAPIANPFDILNR
jgi:hypothetical protein